MKTNFKNINEVLFWANEYSNFVFLNGNSIDYPFNSFENQIAVSNSIDYTSDKHKLCDLENEKLVFGYISYDYKNQTHNLPSNNNEFIKFKNFEFFKPEISFKTNGLKLAENHFNAKPISIQNRVEKGDYINIINKLKNHIVEGDFYEINFCMEFYSENYEINPIDLYLKLNDESPTPFSTLSKFGDNYIICASPERFIKKENNKVISQPIKGTSKRGKTEVEDAENKYNLLNSEKERAENLMIVDLVRNDLAKSSIPGSVQVEELFGIYSFKHVHQMISTVSSTPKESISNTQIIENAFPMGSMTGAPKRKVMETIEEYENSKRGVYSGTVGYIDFENDNFDFNVVIRSILYNQKTKKLSFQVGGAITYDSDPELEYEECLLKAKAIINVLNPKTC